MLKYKFYNCNIWFKKRSHGYVNAKPWLFLKKLSCFCDSLLSFINLSYIKAIWDPSV